MMKTVLAGENLVLFLEKINIQELKKMDNIALLSDDFLPTLKVLLEKNYKIDIVAIDDTTLITDMPLQVINIKLQK